jgi:hypothetical protein
MSVNSVLTNVASQITGAIRQAAQSTGISFEYLLTTAQIESNLNPSAQAPTSSAKGLYQFIEQTWLGTVKNSGPANGYGNYADAISRSANGRYEVADPAMRTAIMKLRSDPAASATMAGSFTRNNAEQLRAAIGRAPSEGELYIAHFLGPDGASKLIGAASNRPNASAAEMFPQAAAANPSIFYSSFSHARSVGDVYAKLTGRFETARAMRFAPIQTAAPVQIAAPVRAAAPTQTTARVRTATPDTAGVAQAFAQANAVPPPLPMPEARPLFQSMFTDRARSAVAQTVTSLWTPAKSGAGSREPVRALDLFTDSAANPRKLFSGDAT